MSVAALNDMKCWAAAMLVFAILSFNLAIFITGIVGCSLVLCCASSNQQAAPPPRNPAQPRAVSTAPSLGRVLTVADRHPSTPLLEQVARNASCFKGCAIACAVLAGLHTLGFLA